MRYSIMAVLLCAISFNAQAYFVTGNDLVNDMREWENANNNSPNTNYTDAARYSGYLKGIYDAFTLNDLICSGQNTTVGQVTAVVGKYLVNNPEQWDEPAYYLVADALKAAFPC